MAKYEKHFRTLSDAQLSKLLSNNIKVYPIYKNGFWFVEVDVYGKKKIFNKKIGLGNTLSTKSPNYGGVNWIEAIEKTYLYYYEKLKF